MTRHPHTPPLRIEIRATPTPGAEDSAPWHLLDLAQTETQAADKIARAKLPAGTETRVRPNTALTGQETILADTPETKQLVEQLNSEKLGLHRQLISANARLAMHEKLAATPTDAVVGPTPLPFDVGATMRDVHTGVAVRVTAINPPHPRTGNIRPGFAWENLTTKPGEPDHTGFCPLASVGCFTLIRETDPVFTPPSGAEAPPPPVKPAAPAPVASDATPPAVKVTAAKPAKLAAHKAPAAAKSTQKKNRR